MPLILYWKNNCPCHQWKRNYNHYPEVISLEAKNKCPAIKRLPIFNIKMSLIDRTELFSAVLSIVKKALQMNKKNTWEWRITRSDTRKSHVQARVCLCQSTSSRVSAFFLFMKMEIPLKASHIDPSVNVAQWKWLYIWLHTSVRPLTVVSG